MYANSPVARHFFCALPLTVALIALALGCLHYLPFISDDALISLRYTQRLLEGQGLTWTEGVPVEGYSNLLWVLLCAVPGLLGFDLLHGQWALGMLLMTVPLWVAALRYAKDAATSFFTLAVLLLFVLSGPIPIWAVGGLEQALQVALLALVIPRAVALVNQPATAPRILLGIALGLLCWTRPDGPLFAVALGLALLLCGGLRHWRYLWLVFAIAVGFWAAQMIFRLGYYGDWVPNTARVKLVPNAVRWQQGWGYVREAVIALAPISLLSAISLLYLLALPPLRRCGVLLTFLMGLWLCYVAFIGGDIFPGWRHLVPALVFGLFALLFAGSDLMRRNASAPKRQIALIALCVSLIPVHAISQRKDPANERAVTERWEWEGAALGKTLKHAFHQTKPLVAVTAAGCIPYGSELPSLDLLGLNDHWLPRHPPADFGTGYLGHELGNARYTLSRQPDVIVFGVGDPQPQFRVGHELSQSPEFHAAYAPIRLRIHSEAPEPVVSTATLYVRKDSAALGLHRRPGRLSIPAILLATGHGGEVVALPDGGLALPIHLRQSARYRFSAPADGAWRIQLQGTGVSRVMPNMQQSGSDWVLELMNPDPYPALVEHVILLQG